MPVYIDCGGNDHGCILWAAIDPQLTTLATANPQQSNGIVSNASQAVYFRYSDADTFMPMLMADSEGDMILVFNDSSATLASSIYETGRAAADPEGTMGQGNSGGSGAWAQVVKGATASGSPRFGTYSACALTTNLVSRGIVYCAGEFGGPNTSATTSGWDTGLYSLFME